MKVIVTCEVYYGGETEPAIVARESSKEPDWEALFPNSIVKDHRPTGAEMYGIAEWIADGAAAYWGQVHKLVHKRYLKIEKARERRKAKKTKEKTP